MSTLVVGAWASIDKDTPIRYKIPFGGVATISFGDIMDLSFDGESLRELAKLSAAASNDLETWQEPAETS